MKSKHGKDADIFKAFSDEKRLDILDILKNGEQCACVIMEQMDVTQSGLSYHMKILTESGIVEGRQEGKWTYYKISEEGRERICNLFLELTETR